MKIIMNLLLENKINHALSEIFKQLELDEKFAIVKVSDRPDFNVTARWHSPKLHIKIRVKSAQ